MDIGHAKRLLEGRTLAEQVSTAAALESLATMTDSDKHRELLDRLTKALGSAGEIHAFLFSLLPVSEFFDTVLLDVSCDPRMGIPELLDALVCARATSLRGCNRLYLFTDSVSASSGEDAEEEEEMAVDVFGRGMREFSLSAKQTHPCADNGGLRYVIKGLSIGKHTLTNVALKAVGFGPTGQSHEAFEQLCALFVSDNFVLSVLDLSHNHLTDSQVALLLDAFETCPAITVLDLTDNMLTSAAVKDIAQRGPTLLELNLGTVRTTGEAVPLPGALLTMNMNEFSIQHPADTIILIANEADAGMYDDAWPDSTLVYYRNKLIKRLPLGQLSLIKKLILVVYNEEAAKKIVKAAMGNKVKLFPALQDVQVFGCEVIHSSTVHTAPAHSCLRQNNTHILLGDHLLEVILAGACVPFGEEAFKDDLPVDRLVPFDIARYMPFWRDEGLCWSTNPKKDSIEQRFTTVITLLAENPSPGGAKFVLRNKMNLTLEIFQQDETRGPDGRPYKGQVTIKFLKPTSSEQKLFASTLDVSVDKLLQHALLSTKFKAALTRAGIALVAS